MKIPAYTYMADCNKNGIRIYPVLEYGHYHLVVEFNESPEFHRMGIIKTQKGDLKYDLHKKDWSQKILKLYKHLYHSKVAPKMSTEIAK